MTDDRADKILQNDILLARMIRDGEKLIATLDHTDYGVTTHEILTSLIPFRVMKKRTGALMAEIYPQDET